MRPIVIVNPRSGGGRAGSARYLGEVRAVIERRLGPVDVALTEFGGHAIDLARRAATEGRSLVVALGGDGTLHEWPTASSTAEVGRARVHRARDRR